MLREWMGPLEGLGGPVSDSRDKPGTNLGQSQRA